MDHVIPEALYDLYIPPLGILAGIDNGVVEDDQIILDPNSNLGIFLRRCILTFNLLSFEVVMITYFKQELSSLNCFLCSCSTF